MPLRLDSQSADFPKRFRSLLATKRETAEDVETVVRGIVSDVAARGDKAQDSGALAGVPIGMTALTRALKLQSKAGKVGFDWNDPLAVLAKIREECDEIEAEILHHMEGSVCRCGAHPRILRAIKAAAKQMQEARR